MHAVFDRDRKGNIISGIYEEGTHRVVPVENCLIEDEKSQAIIRTIRGMLKSFKIRTYDETQVMTSASCVDSTWILYRRD